jgi:hypothetical protein
MSRPSQLFRFFLSCSLVGVFAITAQADTVVSNFGPFDAFGDGGLLLQGPDANTIGDVNQAAAFTVGPTGYLLTGIDIGINSGGPGVSTGPIDIVLAADAAGLPGAALQNSIDNITMEGKQIATGSYPGTLLLAANTTYWVIADAEGAFDGGWNFNSTGDVGPTAGQSEGFEWNAHNPEQRFAFRVEGRPAVPEPASLISLGSALIGLLAYARRRQ